MKLKTTHAPEIDETSLRAALEKLQRWDAKNTGHQSEKRTGERYLYQSQAVVICIPLDDASDAGSPRSGISFPARARNLSRSGLSFIIPRDILPRVTTEDARPVDLDRMLTQERRVHVALMMKNGTPLWVWCKV